MELSDYLAMLASGLLGNLPALILWIAVIVLATVVRRRGGGRAAGFLIGGAVVKIIASLLRIPMTVLVPLLLSRGYSTESIAPISANLHLALSAIDAAGIICIIYAFWVKFKEKNITGEIAAAPVLERGPDEPSPEY